MRSPLVLLLYSSGGKVQGQTANQGQSTQRGPLVEGNKHSKGWVCKTRSVQRRRVGVPECKEVTGSEVVEGWELERRLGREAGKEADWT